MQQHSAYGFIVDGVCNCAIALLETFCPFSSLLFRFLICSQKFAFSLKLNDANWPWV